MRKRSVVWGAVLVLSCGVLATGCKKSESEEYAEATPSAEATPAMASEPAPAPSLTDQVAGAQLTGPSGVSGVITFTQEAGGVHIVARVEHAAAGKHGFHLHAAGACDGPDFKSAGDHFNPGNAPHGAPDAAAHHAGDFGNIEVAADGTGNLDIVSTMLSLDQGDNAVVGKSVILHKGTDDLATQPSGNSGDRIACGIVQRAQGQAETGAAPATLPPAEAAPSATPAPQ